jgi:hypothetical protein
MPARWSAHRCLQNSPSDFLGNTVVEVKTLKRALDAPEHALSNGYTFRILESIRIRVIEDRPKSDGGSGTQSLYLIRIAYYRD